MSTTLSTIKLPSVSMNTASPATPPKHSGIWTSTASCMLPWETEIQINICIPVLSLLTPGVIFLLRNTWDREQYNHYCIYNAGEESDIAVTTRRKMDSFHSWVKQKVILGCTQAMGQWNTTTVFCQHRVLRRSRWFLSAALHLPGCCPVLNRRWWWSPGFALLPEAPGLCTFWCYLIPQPSLRAPDIPASPPAALPAPLPWRSQFLEKPKAQNTTLIL